MAAEEEAGVTVALKGKEGEVRREETGGVETRAENGPTETNIAEARRRVEKGTRTETVVGTATRGETLAQNVGMRSTGGQAAVGSPPGNAE